MAERRVRSSELSRGEELELDIFGSHRHGVVEEIIRDRVGIRIGETLFWLRPESLVHRITPSAPAPRLL